MVQRSISAFTRDLVPSILYLTKNNTNSATIINIPSLNSRRLTTLTLAQDSRSVQYVGQDGIIVTSVEDSHDELTLEIVGNLHMIRCFHSNLKIDSNPYE